MKYKRLLGVLVIAFVVSCLLALALQTFQTHYPPGQQHLEPLRFLLALATLPGEFVAMIMKGMCNTNTAAGIAIKILVNTAFYFVPMLVVAAAMEMKFRQRQARKTMQSEANVVDAQRG
jgi:hypothetical protein